MLSLPDSVAKSFKLEAHINFDNNKVDFWRKYPNSLYGHNYFWENEGTFTFVYYDLIPDNTVVYSFPVSHDIYLAGIESDSYSTKYAGSNEAGVISSFEKSMPYKELLLKMCKMDLYAAIKYDPYRKVYYRFLRKAIPDATYITALKDKPLVIIMYDDAFKYLGETTVGTCRNFNWENTFVTAEGLNIEYIDENDLTEEYLDIKLFIPQKM
jgi:hypothetical protein